MIDELVEKLVNFGLTPYEAKAYAALLSLGEATAREISDVSKIPRTKVYDVMKKLAYRGFIEMQPGNPTLFKAMEPLEIAGKLQQEMVGKIRDFISLTEKLKVEKRKKIQHVWISRGRFAVESKVHELLNQAEEELLLFIIDPSFGFDIPKPDITRILLYEKIAVSVSLFKVVDREKLRSSGGFYGKFAELLEGYTFSGVEFKPVFLGIADGKKSVLAFKEGKELVAATITIPMIVLIQKALFESLWESYTL